ncbi:bifunctional riboflavin kinase/FAD synthetase, partial [candidate division KSB3 bacterium]|nr:bifunctional riboflavin kinase/FAD synthetase [candidate division KSB3 bacterium]MBD3325751.1 bifunctional riboflavin kinase/FAD synthetase [candidate division KSB3 bacterium]
MKIFSTLAEIREIFPNPVLTMGNFDGVHFGHQTIFRMVQARAHALQGTSMVITFDPHPQKILCPEQEFYLLNHLDEKIAIIREIGIDVVICMAFTRDFAEQAPEEFVRRVLVETLHIQEMYVGYNSRLGKGQQGSPASLQQWGEQYGFRVTIVPPIIRDGTVVSSTKIRQLIQQGQVAVAARLLNRPYALDGRVVAGTQRGSTLLGYPTANIEIVHELIPKHGVYICQVVWQDHAYPAVVSIGTNPTFSPARFTIEAHLLDFAGDLYGESIRTRFL